MIPDPAQVLGRRIRAWHLEPDRRTVGGTKNLTQVCRTASGRRVVVKCAPNPFDHGVAREAQALSFVSKLGVPELRLPTVHAYDAESQVLALRWIDSPTLYAQRLKRRRVARRMLADVGRALAGLHGATASLTATPDLAWAAAPEETLIDCFVWTRPAFATRLSPAGMNLFGVVQGDRAATAGLIELTRTPPAACLIHGDAKELNLLASPRGPVWLDWELAQIGDPAQDLGSLLSELLRCEIAPEVSAERLAPSEASAGRAAILGGYATLARPPSASSRRRIQLWTGAHLLIYAHMLVLSDGVLLEPAARLLHRARRLLRGDRRA